MRIFREKQRFNQWWMQLLNLSLIGGLLFMLYQWYIAEVPVDKVAEDDYAGQVFVALLVLATIVLFYILHLKTEIDDRGIHYRFFPIQLKLKSAHWHDIKTCEVRTYHPMKEYGGWGYKFAKGNEIALSARGNKGIQIEFKNGKKLLIGTQRPEDAERIIKRYFKHERI